MSGTTSASSAHYIDIDARPGFVASFGDDHPRTIVLIHTAGQSGLQWRDSISGLVERGFRVVVPDLPGHGHSEEPVDGPCTDLGYYADWVIEMIERLGLVRPYVVGCSIGGKVALTIATRRSADLSGAVCMAADAINDGQDQRSLRRNLSDSVSPARTDRTYYGTLAAVGSAAPEERALRIAARHRREDPQVALSDLIGWARHDVVDKLGDISCPLHLVVGDDDFWLDPASVRRTADAVHGARFTVLPEIGHYPMEEVADFASLLAGWIDQLDVSDLSPSVISADGAPTFTGLREVSS
jgi:pimeloyl-ACP methyl ester carboxylesterase